MVEIANINSQLQVVLSGTRVGVSLACDRLRNLGLGARAVNLPVSGPYHTSLMKEAGESLYPMVELVPLSTPNPNLSLVSSVNGKILKTANDVRQDLFGALYKPVRWLDSIDTMVNNGVERFICLGPGRACAHLLSKELALRDKLSGNSFGNGENKREFEVWSVATVEDVSIHSRVRKRNGVQFFDIRTDQNLLHQFFPNRSNNWVEFSARSPRKKAPLEIKSKSLIRSWLFNLSHPQSSNFLSVSFVQKNQNATLSRRSQVHFLMYCICFYPGFE